MLTTAIEMRIIAMPMPKTTACPWRFHQGWRSGSSAMATSMAATLSLSSRLASSRRLSSSSWRGVRGSFVRLRCGRFFEVCAFFFLELRWDIRSPLSMFAFFDYAWFRIGKSIENRHVLAIYATLPDVQSLSSASVTSSGRTRLHSSVSRTKPAVSRSNVSSSARSRSAR